MTKPQKQMKIKFYADPGHGWAAVPVKTLRMLSILYDITEYSYIRGKTAYLEEDVDFNTFAVAMREQGLEFGVEYKHTDKRSSIRSYDRYDSYIAELRSHR